MVEKEYFHGLGLDDIPKAGTIVPKTVLAILVGLVLAGLFYVSRLVNA